MELKSDIQNLKGVGEKMAKRLSRLGVESILDLIYFFPRRYLDFTSITDIASIPELLGTRMAGDESLTIKGSIIAIANKKTRRRNFTVTEAVVADKSGTISVVWFNQPYLAKMLQAGSSVTLSGRVAFNSFSNTYVMESPIRAKGSQIIPVYPETAGISSFYINKLLGSIRGQIENIREWVPSSIIKDFDLDQLHKALNNIHFPIRINELKSAQRRLAFEELFLISLQANIVREESSKKRARSFNIDLDILKGFISKLPFALTDDQKKAVWQIVQDMENDRPMSRLLNGDVGSGKTIVAAIASLVVKGNGFKTLIMAPTEILANQHFDTFKKIFSADDQIALITGSRKIFPPSAKIIIGTHALLNLEKQEDIGLVVVDEQHRFGVKQREALREVRYSRLDPEFTNLDPRVKPEDDGLFSPHFLSMTATPIPRTMHLALFGDLDVSVIREKPKNRKEIKTRFVDPWKRDQAYDFIRKQISIGRQAFVICPLIEEAENIENTSPYSPPKLGGDEGGIFDEDRKSVKAEFEKLQKIFPQFKIAMLHGKMKPKEKSEVMDAFCRNTINILVSTSVVEVGVDVPNAAVMIIEDAERFGLAQIHQFRGRVGRGEHQSFCLLFSNSRSDKAIARLHNLENTADGFKLAEIDLETRGPGAIFGTEQSGLLDLKMASISDTILLNEAATAAKKILPELSKYPLLCEKIDQYRNNKHLE